MYSQSLDLTLDFILFNQSYLFCSVIWQVPMISMMKIIEMNSKFMMLKCEIFITEIGNIFTGARTATLPAQNPKEDL